MPSEAVSGVPRRDVTLGAKKFAPILTEKPFVSVPTENGSSHTSDDVNVSFFRDVQCSWGL